MPSATYPFAPSYEAGPPTNIELDYVDLAVIDFTKAGTHEGRLALAAQVKDALKTIGFFYVVGHGYSPEQTKRIFDIADIAFAHTSEDEKREYIAQMKQTGSFQGYKPKSYWHIDNGVRDQIENYALNRDVTLKTHPKPLRPFLPEIGEFAKFNHFNVLHEVLRLLALGLELPEDTFVKLHGFEAVGESYIRFMKYFPRSEEEEKQANGLWLKGHTDLGSITILWNQPISALQLLCPDGQWRFIKYIPNSLVVNIGDAIDFLTGGTYKATIHRVVQPPEDQRDRARLGVFYFAMADDNVRLNPSSLGASSPLISKITEGEDAPTMQEWRKARTIAYGTSTLKKEDGASVETELIEGHVIKHYN